MKEGKTNKYCLNCGHEFTFKEKYRGTGRRNGLVICPNCGSRYKHDLWQVNVLLTISILSGPCIVIYMSSNQIPIFPWLLIVVPIFITIINLIYTRFMVLLLDPAEGGVVEMMQKEVTRKSCLICGHVFTYREKFQSMNRKYWRMNCRACGTRYKVPRIYRFMFGGLLIAPLFLMRSNTRYDWGWDISWSTMIVCYVAVGVLFFLIPLFTPLQLNPNKTTTRE
jgi:CXXC-20-CXXC protein